MNFLRVFLAVFLLALGGTAVAQVTVTLQQGLNGYTGSTDAWLWSGAADTNYGAETDWKMQFNTTTATLLRFAIFQAEGGPVPNGATITAATLSVYKFNGATSGTYNARRLLRSWGESQATWNSALSGSPWESGGAQGASDATTQGEAQVTMGTELGWLNYDVLAIAQAWAGGAANHGFRMRQIAGENQGHYFYAKDHPTQAALRPKLTITYTTPSGCASGPFGGTAWTAPGTIEAEDFDCGGEGTAYHDQTVGNQSTSTYRNPESVDVLDLAGGGRAVQYFDTGEWMKYTINVPTAGNFNLAILAASNWVPAGQVAGQYSIEVGGRSTGAVNVISTGSWDTYEWTNAPTSIFLPAGQHVLKLNSVQLAYRVDKIRLEPGLDPLTCEDAPQRPFTTAIDIPAGGRTFEAENYDCGGEGVAYHDLTPGNQLGSTYRTGESVDVWDIPGGGQVVRNFDTGEWMEYTIDVASEGGYRLGIMAGHNATPGLYRIDVDGNDATGNVTVPSTGSWDVYQWFDSPNVVHLTAGTHVLRLSSVQQHFRVEKLRVMPAVVEPTACGPGGSSIDPADVVQWVRADLPFAGQSGHVQLTNLTSAISGVPESGIVQNGRLRFGKVTDPADPQCKAFTLLVNRNDGNEPGVGAKRAEITFGKNIQFNQVYWVAVKVYVPGWGTLSGEGSLFGTQMHSGNDSAGLSPSFGIYTTNDATRFEIQARWGLATNPTSGQTVRCSYANQPLAPIVGRWTDFVFKLRHNTSGAGFLDVWMDGQQIVQHPGSTPTSCSPSSTVPVGKLGFDTPGFQDYAKFGYYTWAGNDNAAERQVLLRSPVVVADPSGNKYDAQNLRDFINQ
jgi:hypothetical protein